MRIEFHFQICEMQVVDHHLEEVPGLYGGVRIEEKILQRIWKEGLFNQQNLKTECGKLVQIIDPGTWNQGEEGPDFKNAVLQMNENKIFGDIEVHFHGKDWERHGHHKDENFKKVILQVCLFPDDKIGTGKISCSASKTLPQLTLLSKLFKGLEEYGEQWAIEALADYNSSQKGPKKPAGIEKNVSLDVSVEPATSCPVHVLLKAITFVPFSKLNIVLGTLALKSSALLIDFMGFVKCKV